MSLVELLLFRIYFIFTKKIEYFQNVSINKWWKIVVTVLIKLYHKEWKFSEFLFFFKYCTHSLKIRKKFYNMCIEMTHSWWEVENWTSLLTIKKLQLKIVGIFVVANFSQKNSQKIAQVFVTKIKSSFFQISKINHLPKKGKHRKLKNPPFLIQ